MHKLLAYLARGQVIQSAKCDRAPASSRTKGRLNIAKFPLPQP